MPKQLLVAEEVAEILRVDKQRVYELIRTGQIPFIRIGERQYRFAVDEIDRWLESGGTKEKGEQSEQ